MKTLLAIAFSLIASLAIAADKEDPIIGRWKWYNKQIIDITADGRMTASKGASGTWEFSKNREVERKYVLRWDGKAGFSIDAVTLSRDYREMTGKNDAGEKVSAKRMAQ